jgi:hypothetical protein
MEWLGIIAVVLVVYFFLQSGKKGKASGGNAGRSTGSTPASPRGSARDQVLDDNIDWLRARWANADRARSAGTLANFPAWYFDPVTERQLERMHRDGISVSGVGLTKGKASDLIGLLEPIEEKHEAILRFFKVPLRGMNHSRAIYEVSKLFADAKNVAAWKLRPAEPLQKEFLRFFDMKCPKGLTCAEGERLINDYRVKLLEEHSPKLDEWDSFESIVTDLFDKEAREDYDLNIKKPSLSVLSAAIDALRKEGNSMDDLAGDLDIVAQKLIKLKPDLEKQR